MKNSMNLDTETIERLKELGLTEYDAKIYCTLVARNSLTAIDLSREAGVPMSKIYVVLSRLENGGWISVIPDRPKRYRAVDPGVTIDHACRQALDRLESTKCLLNKSLKETYDGKAGDIEDPEFLVVHGTVNAMNHFKEILQSQKSGIMVMAVFVNPRTVNSLIDLIKGYDGPKQLFIIDEAVSLRQFTEQFGHLPYTHLVETSQKWHGGIVFLYTDGAGMYGTVEGDDFKMALVIRDMGLLTLMKTFSEVARYGPMMAGPDSADAHTALLASHGTKAIGAPDRGAGRGGKPVRRRKIADQ